MFFSNSRFYNVISILGLMGVLDTIILVFYKAGINIGILFPGILGLLFIIASVLYKYYGIDIIGIKKPFNRSILITIGLLWLISFIIIEGMIITGASSEGNKSVDYIVVLGAALHGEEMSLSLSYRMDTALNYLNTHSHVKIIVSGGKGSGENITEAEAMKRFLIRNHVSESRILKEEKSTSTIENLKFSKEIIMNDTQGNPPIMIVTNNFHLFRAKMLANRIGLKSYGLPAKTPISVLFNVYTREYLAILKSYLFDK